MFETYENAVHESADGCSSTGRRAEPVAGARWRTAATARRRAGTTSGRGRALGVTAALTLALLLVPVAAHAFPQLVLDNLSAAPSLDPSDDVSSWSGAANATLTWDVQGGHLSREHAIAHVETDGVALYVRFDVDQREPIVDTQRTNDVGQGTDDVVWVDLWPTGPTGFQYQFFATPNGTHYETSTENTTYAPRWTSYGKIRDRGYTVTMKIPLAVMRGAETSHAWKIQFGRFLRATGEQTVWSYDNAQTQADDPARAGQLELPAAVSAAKTRRARLSTYMLGEEASSAAGGSTTRAGADVSIPVTSSTSFYATFHPDFSNVELDQQTISPTVYPRAFAEVRPLFTQGGANFDNFYCNFCNSLFLLYSPAIPTPSSGYAIEGRQGPASFTSFESLSQSRVDRATSVNLTSSDLRWNATLEDAEVTTPSVRDNATVNGIWYTDLDHWTYYADYGNDAGTAVLRSDQAQYEDAGATWASQTSAVWGGVHRIGKYYAPADGFVLFPDVAGYGLYANKIWTLAPSDTVAAVSLGGDVLRNHDFGGSLDQVYQTLDFDVLTRSLVDVNVTSGSTSLLLGGVFTPVNQSGVTVTLDSGSQTNNPVNFDTHGPSSTPTTISFNTGMFGAGRLDSWVRSSTLRAGTRGTLTLEVDDTDQTFAGAQPNVQWFDRLGYTYQVGSESSLGIGLRKVVGTPPVPNGGGGCVGTCTNVSVAFHERFAHSELYFAYGDPNAITTAPQLLLKWILYTGADKGT